LSTGVLSEVQLQDSGTDLVKPSQTLTCVVLHYSITRGYLWDWISQPPRKGLEWMEFIGYDSSTYYNTSLKSHRSISRDKSKNQLS
jgi:immunoglobulin heavy chain